ncbi:MAG: IreB family regulatory phosphoprotein [Ruminococcaceae bacterium]|nr:IreB family regulatory phosphoprotein [Oscillospiraceae bacterium]
MLNETEKNTMRADIAAICDAIKKEGGDPIKQLSGYILSEDTIYIPPEVRSVIRKYDRDDLLDVLISEYIK